VADLCGVLPCFSGVHFLNTEETRESNKLRLTARIEKEDLRKRSSFLFLVSGLLR